ncbi:unnamed protein product, partial [Prorocentrum cordatum]
AAPFRPANAVEIWAGRQQEEDRRQAAAAEDLARSPEAQARKLRGLDEEALLRNNPHNEHFDGLTEGGRNFAANSRRAPSASPARTTSSVAHSAVYIEGSDDAAASAAPPAAGWSGGMEQ